MIVAINLSENEEPVWNEMWQMFLPCESHIAKLGMDYERCKQMLDSFIKDKHDPDDIISIVCLAELIKVLADSVDALQPYENEWFCARHGYSLN
tara:strand:+ start:255 stop:536 length:282 start_codon:yes stop_codon:yes gene_type:complete